MASSSSLKSPAPTLSTLRQQLNGLQASLDPVLAAPLADLTSQLEAQQRTNSDGGVILSGCLQSAQLQSSIAYVLLDLVWILLKLNGTDPVAHPVTAELKRVQQYMQKVHNVNAQTVAAEYGSKANVESRQAPEVDKAKASRFIRGSLGAQGKRTIFAEDGTVQSVVSAGEAKEPAAGNEEDVDEESNEDASQTSNINTKRDEKRIKTAKGKASSATQKSPDAKLAKKRTRRNDK